MCNGDVSAFACAVGAKGKIIERRALQTGQRHRSDITDVKIGVQAFFNLQGVAAGVVGGVQFHGQSIGHRDDKFRTQILPRLATVLRQRKMQRDRPVRGGVAFDELPLDVARKSRGTARLHGCRTQGKQIGTTSRIGLSGANQLFMAHKNQRRLAVFLEMREVRAVRIDLRCTGFGSNDNFGQSAIPATTVTRRGFRKLKVFNVC